MWNLDNFTMNQIPCSIFKLLHHTKFYYLSNFELLLQKETFSRWIFFIEYVLQLSMLQFKYDVHFQQSTSQSTHVSPLGLTLKLHVPPSRLSPVGWNGALIVEVKVKLYVDVIQFQYHSKQTPPCVTRGLVLHPLPKVSIVRP